MATLLDAAPRSYNAAVFASVFPERVHPPTNHKRFEADNTQHSIEAAQQLEQDTRRVLGIYNEGYVLPTRNGTSFMPHFESCPPIEDLVSPSPQDTTILVREMLKVASINTFRSQWNSFLGPDRVKKIFAATIDKAMSDFVTWSYSGVYHHEVWQHLRFWAEHVLATWITVFLQTVDNLDKANDARNYDLPKLADIENYQRMTYSRLWALRVDELFDMVVDWDNTIAGVDDIKPLLTTPQARHYVVQKFTQVIQTRLLHPGASTIEILQIYVSIIRAFRRLDPRGVLISKISGRIRQYLRERDDTIKVVVAGLLSDVSASPERAKVYQANSDVLSELAWELQHRDPNAGKHVSSLDWNNMNWQPEPIDALPESSKSAKHTDVIGSVISLFESKDIFVKELQIMLAERLLRNKDDYDQEISVVEHLKIRFGDTALQACEVMLRDVIDSKRLDQVIRKDQGLTLEQDEPEEKQEPELHAKILSRLFWPSLPGVTSSYSEDDDEEPFKPPLSILHQRNLYEKGFESLKQTRKLTWNDNLGQVEIELTFADGRTHHDQVLPYQAGVIYAFNDDTTASSPTTKTISSLSAELSLPPTLVRSACLLFVSKRILTPSPNISDAYTVLEYLPPTPGTATAAVDITTHSHTAPTSTNADLASTSASAAAAQAAANRAADLASQQAAREAETKEKRAKMAVYQQFITAMLTNQGAMPLPRIAMMLGMVVPGGFPFSNEELKEFLHGMVREGSVAVAGANYRKA